jgi:hypothetical protein
MTSCNLQIKDLLLISSMVPYNAEGILSKKIINLLLPSKAVLSMPNNKTIGSYQNYIRISRNSDLITAFARMDLEDRYQLIGCF